MTSAATPGAVLLAWVAETPFEALPKPAVEMGRLAMLDWWGVAVGGVDEPVTRLLREAMPEPEGPASVLGTDRTASPVTAAWGTAPPSTRSTMTIPCWRCPATSRRRSCRDYSRSPRVEGRAAAMS